jgi:hypothetical protein
MRTVAEIFTAWPTDADLARDIGVRYPTISAWKQRGSIPPAYWRDIIRAARQRGHPELTADLLAELHARKPALDAPSGFAEEAAPMRAPISTVSYSAQRPVEPGDRHAEGENLGHFTRFKHLRRDRFRTLDEINDHIAALREEWDRR